MFNQTFAFKNGDPAIYTMAEGLQPVEGTVLFGAVQAESSISYSFEYRVNTGERRQLLVDKAYLKHPASREATAGYDQSFAYAPQQPVNWNRPEGWLPAAIFECKWNDIGGHTFTVVFIDPASGQICSQEVDAKHLSAMASVEGEPEPDTDTDDETDTDDGTGAGTDVVCV